MTSGDLRVITATKFPSQPYHFQECGLDNMYLLNGFDLRKINDQEYVSIMERDKLYKCISIKIATKGKTLTQKECKFLRVRMDKSQQELAVLLRVSAQTVHRWETVRKSLPGPGDVALRSIFLGSECAQPEGQKILMDWLGHVNRIIADERKEPSFHFMFEDGDWNSQSPKRWSSV